MAIDHYLQSYRMQMKVKQFANAASMLNNIGTVYFYSEDYANALKYFEDALALELEQGSYAGKVESTQRQVAALFGARLAASAAQLFVSCPGAELAQGEVHLIHFDATAGDWVCTSTVSAPDSTAGAGFGQALTYADRTLLAGAPWAQTSVYNAHSTVEGAAYFFALQGDRSLAHIEGIQPFAQQTRWTLPNREGMPGWLYTSYHLQRASLFIPTPQLTRPNRPTYFS